MDSDGFVDWLKWWYEEVKKKSTGPWLLIMDNCGGHESEIILPGVRIELLPPRSTAKYQPLDLGLIAHSKIRYRSILLRITILVMLRRHAEDSDLPTSSKQGMLGLHDGFLPTVGDAMELFDESWSQTSRSTVIKCWIKSECLLDSHVQQCTEILHDITSILFSSQDLISDPISASEAELIATDLNLIQSLDTPATPLS